MEQDDDSKELKLIGARRVTKAGIGKELIERPYRFDETLLLAIALDGFQVLAICGAQAV